MDNSKVKNPSSPSTISYEGINPHCYTLRHGDSIVGEYKWTFGINSKGSMVSSSNLTYEGFS